MEQLSPELMREILGLLPVRDVKSMRLVSRQWGILGEDLLIAPTFVALPHRNDYVRLYDLAQHPRLCYSIEAIEFNLARKAAHFSPGTMRMMPHQMSYADWLAIEDKATATNRSLQKQMAGSEHTYCKLDLLQGSFDKLNNLRRIDIVLTKCPINDDMMQPRWPCPDPRAPFQIEIIRNLNRILYAAAGIRLQHLSCDYLPGEFLAQPNAILQPLFKPFSALRSLSIHLGGLTTTETCYSGLQACLQSTPELREFELGGALDKVTICIAGLLDGFRWKYLHTVALEAMYADATDLLQFMLAHKSSLRRLRLGGMGSHHDATLGRRGLDLTQSTYRTLLRGLRAGLSLDTFQLCGNGKDAREMSPLDVVTVLYDPNPEPPLPELLPCCFPKTLHPIYDKTWMPLADGPREGRLIEDYVLRREDFATDLPTRRHFE